ncbi:MAG: tetratricopeptide repeat protein [Chitinophagaceae bacterium]|nr:tetratricopeptide repeat protein [Oligoflexus sp.]
MAKPQKIKTHNQKDLATWSVILLAIFIASGAVFWKIRSPENHINIPETAFEKKPARSRFSEEARRREPQTLGATGADNKGPSEPKPASTLLRHAMELVDQGHWDEAEPLLLAELDRNPKDEGVLLELAMIQILDRHELAKAQPYLERAIRINPANDGAIEELLGVYEEGQGWEQAVRFFESVPVTPESQAALDYGKGTALLSAGHNAEAVDVLRKAVYEDDNKAFTTRESLATAYESTGRWEDASHEYEAVISGPYKPEQIRLAKIHLANTYAAQKNFSGARAILEPLVEADPKDHFAAQVLGQVARREHKQ